MYGESDTCQKSLVYMRLPWGCILTGALDISVTIQYKERCNPHYRSRSIDDFGSSGWWWLFDLEVTCINACVFKMGSKAVCVTLLEYTKVKSVWQQLKAAHVRQCLHTFLSRSCYG